MASIGNPGSTFGYPAWHAGLAGSAREVFGGLLRTEQERFVLWLPVGLGLGIGLYFLLSFEPPLWLGASLLGAVLLFSFVRRHTTAALAIGVALGTLATGFTVAQWRTVTVAAPILERKLGPTTLVAQVLEVPPRAAGGRIVLGSPRISALEGEPHPERLRLRLTKKDPATLSPGDWIRLRAVLRPPPEPAAPGAYDFARQAFFARIGAVGYAVGHAELVNRPQGGPAAANWRLWWSNLRKDIGSRVLARLPGASGGVAMALMTGDRSAIPEDSITAMRDAGLAHLLAISGLHMGLVAGLLFFGVRALLALLPWLALRYPIKKVAALAAWPGGLAYLFLVGATVPSQRAFLMVSLVLLAVLLDRKAISLRLVAWAGLVVLLIAPESLLTASFQMSFAAVVALVAVYEAIEWRYLARRGDRPLHTRMAIYFAGVALTSVIAIAATGPFAIYHFNRVAAFGLIANLAAVPLTAFWVMPWAILAYLLMPLGLESLALVPMGWGLSAILAVAEFVSSLPGAVRPVSAMPLSALLCAVAGGLWLCLWRRTWRFLGLIPLSAALALCLIAEPPDVLVSGDGKLIALRDRDGSLWLSSTRRSTFQAGVWQRRAGQETASAWPLAKEEPAAPLRCDSSGCVHERDGVALAFALTPAALDEDCDRAALLISLVPLRRRPCSAPNLVVDRFDLWRNGTHAIWLGVAGPKLRTVAQDRGRRPWVSGDAKRSASPR